MHDDVPELVREAEPLSIGRHVAIQKDAWRHVRYLNREAIHLERGEVTMNDDTPGSFHPRDKLPDRPGRYEPGAPDEFGDTLGIAAILVNVQTRKRQFWFKFGGIGCAGS